MKTLNYRAQWRLGYLYGTTERTMSSYKLETIVKNYLREEVKYVSISPYLDHSISRCSDLITDLELVDSEACLQASAIL